MGVGRTSKWMGRVGGPALLLLFCASAFASDKTLRIRHAEFKYEGQTYVVEKIVAHPIGGVAREFSPNGDSWYVVKPEPEFGRHIHRQVK